MHSLLHGRQTAEQPIRALKIWLGVISLLALSSCANNPYLNRPTPTEDKTSDQTVVTESPVEAPIEDTDLYVETVQEASANQTTREQAARAQHYQEKATLESDKNARIEATLSAAEHYIQANQPKKATELLGLMTDTISRQDHYHRSIIVFAYADYAQGYYQQALTRLAPLTASTHDQTVENLEDDIDIESTLTPVNTNEISDGTPLESDVEIRNYIDSEEQIETQEPLTAQQVDALLLSSLCYQALGQHELAIAALIRREGALYGSAKAETTRYIWQIIQTIPEPNRQLMVEQSANAQVKNRVQQSLAGQIGDVQSQPQQFNQWREDDYESQISNLSKGEWNATSPRSVYVLLPLNSRYRKAATAVKSGIEREHFLNNSAFSPTLKFYDIGDNPLQIGQYYRAAIRAGADFIIGPIGKTYSNEANRHLGLFNQGLERRTPILMLGGDQPLSDQAYRLSMSPELEGQRAAEKAWRDGHLSAGILVDSSNNSQRVINGFRQKWLELGGKINSIIEYLPHQFDHSNQLKQLFGVHASERRHRQVSATLGLTPKFSPYQRGDIDFVLMVANSKTGRVVRPQINFYTNQQIPVYSTSAIYNGIVDEINDIDLDGTLFPVMPWVVRSGNVSPYAGQLNMLYALGMDAYRIAGNFGKLNDDIQFSMEGNTGTINGTLSGDISFQPLWARFVEGKLDIVEDKGIELRPIEVQEQLVDPLNNGTESSSPNNTGRTSRGSYNDQNWDTGQSRRKTGG